MDELIQTQFTSSAKCHICGHQKGEITEFPSRPTPTDYLIADELARTAASVFWRLRAHVRGFHGQF